MEKNKGDDLLNIAISSFKKNLKTELKEKKSATRDERKFRIRETDELEKSLPASNDTSDLYNEKKLRDDAVAKIMKHSVMNDVEKGIVGPSVVERRKKKDKTDRTTGPGWYDMKARKPNKEEERDLKMLLLRPYVDPKKHWKSSDHKNKLPEFYQIGKTIDGPQEFYSNRSTRKERTQSFGQQFLQDDNIKKYAKRKAREVQEKSQLGGRKSYKKRTRVYKSWRS